MLDVNVVLAAHRDDHPDHAEVNSWFETMLVGAEPFAVPLLIWASFLRLTTHRRIFEVPTPLADVFEFIEAVRAQPLHADIGPGPRHLALVRRLCEEGDAVGDLIPDAVIGAVAVEYDCELVTLDRDFARFPSVRQRRPTAT
jgi:uncharacterized protein